ncbi:MAG TPA: hypothetical protein VLB90_08025 [Pseudomonadales bacterium]|nr:hypothetical protein [Pseudomonadales bacterium]
MKNLRLGAVIAAMLLLAGILAGLLLKRSDSAPDEAAVVEPQSQPAQTMPQPVPAQQTSPPGVDSVPGSPDAGEETPEFVTEPVTEPDEESHDEQAVAPSAETINAIREMRKPVEGEGQVIQHADGSSEMKLGNRYQSVAVATIGKDGKVHVEYHGEKYVQDNPVSEQGQQNKEPPNKETQNKETQKP